MRILSAVAGVSVLLASGSAFAGGLERGGYNIDLLFDPARVTGEASATYVSPQRKIDNARDTDPTDGIGTTGAGGGQTDGIRATSDYWVPRVGMKVGIVEGVDCMIDYSQPWGADFDPGSNWAGVNHNIVTVVNSDNYAGTCSYKFQAGKGQLRFIGGAFYQEIDGYKDRQVHPGRPGLFTGIGHLELETDGWGWRAGVAYEIPEIAFRASLVYNAEVKLDSITGIVDLTQAPGVPGSGGSVLNVFGSAEMPQSVELKVQSGIAPGWLAFGSVKWVDWSVLQTVAFCSTAIKAAGLGCSYGGPGFVTSLDLLYRDGWTVSGGIGHKFTDQISGSASITWDRGTSTGLGTQTDTWLFSAGASYTPTENVEFRLGGAAGILTSGSSGVVVKDGVAFGTDVAYDFGNDFIGALSGSIKVKF
ncbi:MAG: transporter [Rhizobiaceae bacterium]|nr:transporter [Rhizobiaceae bacterium]